MKNLIKILATTSILFLLSNGVYADQQDSNWRILVGIGQSLSGSFGFLIPPFET
jgi:hypothetical protein